MRPSRLCIGCGLDLALVRGGRDAATGLRVVACPGCSRLQHVPPPPRLARGRVASPDHPWIEARTLAALAFSAVLVLITPLFIAGLSSVPDWPRVLEMDTHSTTEAMFAMIGAFLLCFVTGALFAALMGHWPMWRLVLALAVTATFIAFYKEVFAPLGEWIFVRAFGDGTAPAPVPRWPRDTAGRFAGIAAMASLIAGFRALVAWAARPRFAALRRLVRRKEPWRTQRRTPRAA